MNQEALKEVIHGVLDNTAYRPFLCLPMSALLYATLNDNHKAGARLVTGDLHYKDSIIFKQDFKISDAKDNTYQEWAGHAWVELEDIICDLSFFRTLYAQEFTKPCKIDLITQFGEGRGALIGTPGQLEQNGLIYKPKEYLSDEMATGIIQGYEHLLNFKK